MSCYITGNEIMGPILNQGPQVSNESPARNATDVPRNTNISFDITDLDGVNQSSILVTVNGTNVTQNCTITAISNGFHILYDPPQDFNYGQTVTVTIDYKIVTNIYFFHFFIYFVLKSGLLQLTFNTQHSLIKISAIRIME